MTSNEQPRIRVTPPATREVDEQLTEDSLLRVSFAGGCGAFGYRIGPTRRAYPGDHLITADGGIQLYLDQRAARELDGATIDYDADDGFILEHPQSGRSC